MKAKNFAKKDYRKREGYVPQATISNMDYIVEVKRGINRYMKKKSAHFASRKNTRGFPLGFNQKLWMAYTRTKS